MPAGDQIQAGVRRFGQDAEAPRGEADDDLERGETDRGHHRLRCGAEDG